MWYFSWVLGIGVALAFGVINAMWLETDMSSRKTVKIKDH